MLHGIRLVRAGARQIRRVDGFWHPCRRKAFMHQSAIASIDHLQA
jgi:hypothetical protein